jgi:glycosyltransferase involved in cell wall biosynthesis
MSYKLKFSIIIPVWNEEKNIDKLIKTLNLNTLKKHGLSELIIVNNGSTDNTFKKLSKLKGVDHIRILNLKKNRGYGGGIIHGITRSKTEIVCYIPADLQYSFSDLLKTIKIFKNISEDDKIFLKGERVSRFDSLGMRITSRVYTFASKFILGISTRDTNGLPKMFNKSIILDCPFKLDNSFVLDAQLLYLAKLSGYKIIEVPVKFYRRNQGISSWSNKKIKTYLNSIISLIKFRFKLFNKNFLNFN